ncbi:glycosyltransferase [Thalassospira alkalitolerans]|uniref:glycosyltransferase n=1 Tax=Thalassospira alkalitolerans TaxID=1293890 RepID=UPI003AA7DC2C
MNGLISIIVSTYNWPEALERVLASLEDQTDRNFEIVIADDGSRDETRTAIDQFKAKTSLTVKHFWQEDVGYRLSQVRNGAIHISEGELVIFTDGDCCLMPNFIASHRKVAEQGCFVTGKRVFLKSRFTNFILNRKPSFHKWPRGVLFMLGLLAQCNRPFQFIPLPQSKSSLWQHEDCWKKAQGCNIAAFRKDIDAVAGFDESYIGHGLEDSDFILRLLRLGLKRKNVEYTSPVLHLYHGRSLPQRHQNANLNPAKFDALIAETNRFLPNESLLLRPDKKAATQPAP